MSEGMELYHNCPNCDANLIIYPEQYEGGVSVCPNCKLKFMVQWDFDYIDGDEANYYYADKITPERLDVPDNEIECKLEHDGSVGT